MKRVRLFMLAALWIQGLAAAGTARADLAGDVNKVLEDKLLAKARAGILITRLGTSAADSVPILELGSKDPLIPASNLKIVTTSTALARLGPEFKFRTMLLWHDGDLVIVGDGDPTLGDAEMLKKSGWGVDTVFKSWAAALIKRNIVSAHDVIVDDSVFDEVFIHPNWPADQVQKRYSAEIGGLNLNANCVDLDIHAAASGRLVSLTMNPITSYITIRNTCIAGNENAISPSRQMGTNDFILRGKAPANSDSPIPLTIHDPPLFAGTVLSETLKGAGVNISGSVRRDRSARSSYLEAARNNDHSWVLLAVHETPLLSVIARANKDSMNLYAECLCKRLGFAVSGEGSWKAGTTATADFLGSLGVPSQEYRLDDGCGYSKHNAVSARLLVSVLTYDYFSNSAPDWMNCLSIAGQDGTLSDRFKGTDLRGRVIGKSGFVNGVSALSGYLHAKDSAWYCFSILFNGIPEGSNSSVKPLEEHIVRAIDQYAAGHAVAMTPRKPE